MKYSTLGSTGMTVSRLCLGCMSYGDPNWRPWILDESEARPFFKRALENGINFFDTADMYSHGVSEEVTGRLLREMADLDEIVLATKVFFPIKSGHNRQGLSRKHIVQACEASLRRLGVETVDLYQIHRFDDHVPLEETLAALDHLVRQGKVRYIGASSGYAWQLMKALSISERNGWARFVSMQNHHNLLYREEEREMNPLCVEENIGTIPWSPLARGLLARASLDANRTSRAESDTYTPTLYNESGDRAVLAELKKVAENRGEQPATIALSWLLSQPAVVAPIVGFTRLDHFEPALRALEVELNQEECEQLEAHYVPHSIKGH